MKLALILGLVLPHSAEAQRVDCRLSAPCPAVGVCVPERKRLTFEIDRSQFAPPVHRDEPPRVKVTHVDLGGIRFAAEPMIIGDIIGFWEDAEAMGSRIFTLGPDGIGVYNEDPAGIRLTGRCEVSD